MLLKLSPQDEAQRRLQSDALQIWNDLARSRWQLIEQTHISLPMPFLVVLVFWLVILFMSFSLFVHSNVTVTTMFVLCALSASTAIFLLLEMGSPSEGFMRVSGDPLVRAYLILGK